MSTELPELSVSNFPGVESANVSIVIDLNEAPAVERTNETISTPTEPWPKERFYEFSKRLVYVDLVEWGKAKGYFARYKKIPEVITPNHFKELFAGIVDAIKAKVKIRYESLIGTPGYALINQSSYSWNYRGCDLSRQITSRQAGFSDACVFRYPLISRLLASIDEACSWPAVSNSIRLYQRNFNPLLFEASRTNEEGLFALVDRYKAGVEGLFQIVLPVANCDGYRLVETTVYGYGHQTRVMPVVVFYSDNNNLASPLDIHNIACSVYKYGFVKYSELLPETHSRSVKFFFNFLERLIDVVFESVKVD